MKCQQKTRYVVLYECLSDCVQWLNLTLVSLPPSLPPSLLQAHPPFPLHDDWTPRPGRPVESLRPWDGEDTVRFRLENYTLDAVGKLVR